MSKETNCLKKIAISSISKCWDDNWPMVLSKRNIQKFKVSINPLNLMSKKNVGSICIAKRITKYIILVVQYKQHIQRLQGRLGTYVHVQ